MSAPQTNIERQKRRHAGPILGSVLVVCFALGLFFAYVSFTASEGDTPGTDVPLSEAATTDIDPAE